jgi:hypothetical protein
MSKMSSQYLFESEKQVMAKRRVGNQIGIWLPTTKSRELIDCSVFRCRATYHWKDLDKGYNFALDLISIKGLHAKLWRPKVAEIQTLAISGLPLENPVTKSHLDVGPVGSHRVYYKGEGGGFPQVWAVMSLVCPTYSWLILAPKML